MAGRRPVPTELAKLRGNPGHRPLNVDEPKPPKKEPEIPKGMGRAARREWAKIVPELMTLGVLTSIDGKALAAYCDAYAMWERARKDIDKYGLVIKTPKCDKEGNVITVSEPQFDDENVIASRSVLYELKANPAVGVYNTFAKLMKSYLIEFGLTPASRTKLKLAPQRDPAEDGEDIFMRGPQSTQAVEAAKANAALQFKTGKKTGMPDLTQLPAADTNFEA